MIRLLIQLILIITSHWIKKFSLVVCCCCCYNNNNNNNDFFIFFFYSFDGFLHQHELMVSPWSLSDSKSPQVSSTLLYILSDFNSAVVWMVSTCLLISKSSSSFIDLLRIVPSAPITIGITLIFMFHSFFFSSLVRSFCFLLILLCGMLRCQSSLFIMFFFFLLIIIKSGCLAEIKGSVCISKPQKSLCIPFSRTDSRLCIYHLFVWSNFNFSYNSQWITFPPSRV